MSDQSDTGQPPEPATQEGPPEWLNPITERMNELSESTNRLAEQFAVRQQEPPTAPEPVEVDWYDDEGDLTPEGAQALIDERVDQRVNAVMSERDAATALSQRDQAFAELQAEVDALKDPKIVGPIVRELGDELRDEFGDEFADRLINSPRFVNMIEERYYSGQWHDRADAESASTQQEVVLESASGASQPSAPDEPDWGERIVEAASKLRPQI